ncbi:metallophosphatase family protein [Pseudoduganella sp. SL102]|uniref:metallophosphoesterase family protein n=1 Tax=Pseudoduganella sp. SL102 TaxID=2995154 RepID=UPI00248C304E|nr:metallophosphatase family protein [Pseudoduganella sp. SL102]WBS00116.1 metallophosphatase family protein [Pseudoduganella sp. SL102]
MLTIAHFSDLHYANETLAEVDPCFRFAVDEAIRRRVDVAIITGDTTDHALPAHSPAFAALARNIRRLADHCPVLLLQGTFSHEPPGMLRLFSLLGGRHPIHVSDRIEQVALLDRGSWEPSASWRFTAVPANARLLCHCLPTLNKATLAAAVGAGDATTAMGDQLATLLAGLAPLNAAARAQDLPTIGLSHGTVRGCTTEHGVLMAGLDHEFTTGALFAAGASAFMLGHIHKHQAWREGERLIAYPGSIGRLHYGEQGDKGFLLWEIDAHGARATHIPTPARRTHELVFDGAPDLATLSAFAAEHDLKGAWVRVRWSIAEEAAHAVDRDAIAATLVGAAGIKLEGRVLPVLRSRAAGMARIHDLRTQLATWAKMTATDAAPLLACLHALDQQGPEAIAQQLLAAQVEDADLHAENGEGSWNRPSEPQGPLTA